MAGQSLGEDGRRHVVAATEASRLQRLTMQRATAVDRARLLIAPVYWQMPAVGFF